MKVLAKACRVVDQISIWAGKTGSWFSVVLVGTICYEVVSRYAFNSPTIWSMELGTFLFAAVWLTAGGWTHQSDAHVKVDIFYTRLSKRGKAIMNVCTSPFIFVMMGVVIWELVDYGLLSMKMMEHSPSQWGPPIWIVKMALPVGASMLALQCVAGIIRDLYMSITGKEMK